MDALKEYIIYNWALILVLIAFVIMLIITVFLDKKTKIKMYILIGVVFLLSILVFTEFYLVDLKKAPEVCNVLVAIRYSMTPIIIALIILATVKKVKWYIIIPALVLAVINFVSIFTGIVVRFDQDCNLIRGPLGYLPYIGVGLYSAFLVYILIWRSNKQLMEIVPILFMAFAFLTGIVFPLVIGKDYAKIFCTTMAIAIFVYYVFLILQLTKKDSLSGLLNRQAYYSAIQDDYKDITAVVSIDMNGLKLINDTQGHLEGDNAIVTLSNCFIKSTKYKQFVYRIGGDEFIVLCHKTTDKELTDLILAIKSNVAKTKYSCSVGFCFNKNENKNIEEMIKISDEMMYADKREYYKANGIKR